MADMNDVGRATAVRRIHVAQLEPEIIGHRQGAETRSVAGAEIAVDIGPRQTGILERALGRLRMELGERLVVGLARRMLVDSDDIGLSLDAHCWLISLQGRGMVVHTVRRARSIPDRRWLSRDFLDLGGRKAELAEDRCRVFPETRRRQTEAVAR